MGIVIGEHRLIKRGKKGGREIVANCVTRTRTHTHAEACTHTHIYTVCTHTVHTYIHTHAHTNTTSGIRDSAIMCYGVGGRYGRMAFLIKTIRSLIALGFHLILRH